MKKKSFIERFKNLPLGEKLTIIAMTLIDMFGFYMSISFSVKLGQGYTLFGDSSVYTNNNVEVKGPTQADIVVLILYWVLTIAVLILDVYFVFFKKNDTDKVAGKEIDDGKTIVVKEEENDKE